MSGPVLVTGFGAVWLHCGDTFLDLAGATERLS
jgi:hypothetical protein